ncbi:MAG: hypothetical protein ACRCVA_30120, partial [Phreatobacter sp.]
MRLRPIAALPPSGHWPAEQRQTWRVLEADRPGRPLDRDRSGVTSTEVHSMREQDHAAEPRCLYSPDDIKQMRIKFDQTCEELGLFCEDEAARAAVGRAVVKAFAAGLAEPPA